MLLSAQDVILPQAHPLASAANPLLLHMKFYIYRQRLFHQGTLDLLAFLRELKVKLNVERYICSQEGKPQKFKIWEPLCNAIG